METLTNLYERAKRDPKNEDKQAKIKNDNLNKHKIMSNIERNSNACENVKVITEKMNSPSEPCRQNGIGDNR